jgi:glycosyltransferase involved in cell wall biosynthesis
MYAYSSLRRFSMQQDLKILQKYFDVIHFKYNGLKSVPKLIRTILQSDISFSWFAGGVSFIVTFFSKIFGKKSVVVVGGYGVEVMPEINYGVVTFKQRLMSKFILKNADMLVPFSMYAYHRTLDLVPSAKATTIYLICDTDMFRPSGKKEQMVLTVGFVKKSNIIRKGLDTFVKSAKLLPDTDFILAGGFLDDAIEQLKSIAPPNVKFTGFVSDDELIQLYQHAKVYCQLSYQEGEMAGGALGEAMACECIPVVSTEAVTLKETAGDLGFYVPYGDTKATAEAINRALELSEDQGKKARERMIKSFSFEKREKSLKQLIEKIGNM